MLASSGNGVASSNAGAVSSSSIVDEAQDLLRLAEIATGPQSPLLQGGSSSTTRGR